MTKWVQLRSLSIKEATESDDAAGTASPWVSGKKLGSRKRNTTPPDQFATGGGQERGEGKGQEDAYYEGTGGEWRDLWEGETVRNLIQLQQALLQIP